MRKLPINILFLLLFVAPCASYCQSDTLRHSVIYLEAGGPGGIGSVNIEHHSFEREKFNIGARFGIGTTGFRNFEDEFQPDFFVPFGIYSNFRLMKSKRNGLFLNIGAGLIYASTVHIDENFEAAREVKLNSYFQAGVSYLLAQKLLLRLSYTPIISNGYGLNHWYALSIGYTF
jgi:hypothetical protein